MTINQIYEELEKTINGYISIKNINNKKRYYLQYRDKEKIKSKYIKTEEVERFINKISKRNELEKELDELIRLYPVINAKLSTNSINLTGYLMFENKVVAEASNGELRNIDNAFAPLFIIKHKDLLGWLKGRVMDSTRGNSLLLKRELHIEKTLDPFISLHVHAASIIDHYWFKPKGSRLTYNDVCFKNDFFFNTSLSGKVAYKGIKPFVNPQITLIGSYEKAWKLENNAWWLYKKENEREKFSELFVYFLGSELGFNMAYYELSGDFIRSLNFADKAFFEPICSITSEDSSYSDIFDTLLNISENIAKDYIRLLWLDALVFNYDRHGENYGLLRDFKTGEIISLAPNFDNNNALIAYNYPSINRDKDLLIHSFNNFIGENEVARSLYKQTYIPKVDEILISKVINNCPIKEESDYLIHFLINGFAELSKYRDS